MFTREHLLSSDWYQERLEVKQQRDIELWQRHVDSLQQFLEDSDYSDEAERLGISGRLEAALQKLAHLRQPEYLATLVGTLGADPSGRRESWRSCRHDENMRPRGWRSPVFYRR